MGRVVFTLFPGESRVGRRDEPGEREWSDNS
jgi:hypothetical protein